MNNQPPTKVCLNCDREWAVAPSGNAYDIGVGSALVEWNRCPSCPAPFDYVGKLRGYLHIAPKPLPRHGPYLENGHIIPFDLEKVHQWRMDDAVAHDAAIEATGELMGAEFEEKYKQSYNNHPVWQGKK